LIGYGFFAQNHLNAWREMRSDGVELVSVCDVNGEKACKAANEFAVPKFYEFATEMFSSESLDFVDIAAQMHSHEALVTLAAEHGVATIVQKPLAPDWPTCVGCRGCAARGDSSGRSRELSIPKPMLALADRIRSGAIGRTT
jgi:predicted dehydrogenase